MRGPREALVFVFRGEHVLIVRRCVELGGYWHAVAGAVEADETDAEAARRELREETGLEGDLGAGMHELAYSLDEEPERRALYEPGIEQIQVACFRAEAPAGWEPILNWEHDASRWCTFDEAVSLLRWPAIRDALKALWVQLDAK